MIPFDFCGTIGTFKFYEVGEVDWRTSIRRRTFTLCSQTGTSHYISHSRDLVLESRQALK